MFKILKEKYLTLVILVHALLWRCLAKWEGKKKEKASFQTNLIYSKKCFGQAIVCADIWFSESIKHKS